MKTLKPLVLRYKKEMKITNLSYLPAGLNCPYLVVIQGLKDTYIAKRWARKVKSQSQAEIFIKF